MASLLSEPAKRWLYYDFALSFVKVAIFKLYVRRLLQDLCCSCFGMWVVAVTTVFIVFTASCGHIFGTIIIS